MRAQSQVSGRGHCDVCSVSGTCSLWGPIPWGLFLGRGPEPDGGGTLDPSARYLRVRYRCPQSSGAHCGSPRQCLLLLGQGRKGVLMEQDFTSCLSRGIQAKNIPTVGTCTVSGASALCLAPGWCSDPQEQAWHRLG